MASRRQWIAVPRRPVYRTGFKPASSRRFRKMRKRRKMWRKRTDRKNGRPWKGKDKTEIRQIRKLLLIQAGHQVTEMIKGKDEEDSYPKFIVVFGWRQQWSMMLMVCCKNAASSTVLVLNFSKEYYFERLLQMRYFVTISHSQAPQYFVSAAANIQVCTPRCTCLTPTEVQMYTFLLTKNS